MFPGSSDRGRHIRVGTRCISYCAEFTEFMSYIGVKVQNLLISCTCFFLECWLFTHSNKTKKRKNTKYSINEKEGVFTDPTSLHTDLILDHPFQLCQISDSYESYPLLTGRKQSPPPSCWHWCTSYLAAFLFRKLM